LQVDDQHVDVGQVDGGRRQRFKAAPYRLLTGMPVRRSFSASTPDHVLRLAAHAVLGPNRRVMRRHLQQAVGPCAPDRW